MSRRSPYAGGAVRLFRHRWLTREGLRWRAVDLVGKLPGQCWVDLVTWSQDGTREAVQRADTWKGALPWSSNKGCGPGSPDYERNCVCYCGKVRTAEFDVKMRANGATGRGVVR